MPPQLTYMSPVPGMVITPIAVAVVAAAFAWGLHGYNLLDILPVAKAEVFEGLRDPILVLDREDRIVDMNPAAGDVFGKPAEAVIGESLPVVLADWPELVAAIDGDDIPDIRVDRDEGRRIFELLVSDLADRREIPLGRRAALAPRRT